MLIYLILTSIFINFMGTNAYAQATAADEAREQREEARDRRQEELQELRQLDKKPKTAEEVLQMLKEKAKEKITERRRKELLKTQISAGVTYIYETNPSSAVKGSLTPDPSLEDTFSINWVPKLTRNLSGNVGYSVTDLNYFGEEALGTADHVLNADMIYSAFGGKLSLNDSSKYEWYIYPFDAPSNYEQWKNTFSFTHYLTDIWNWGGKYEYSYKDYDKKASRDEAGTSVPFSREDYRNTGEIWIKRFIGKYSIKLKGKSYRNKSNDEYQDFNDYDAHQGEITLSGNPLGWEKLYASASTDFEVKQYYDRVAVNTARDDRANTHKLNLYYTLNKYAKLNFTFQHKTSSSNAATGEFSNTTYKLGTTVNF